MRLLVVGGGITGLAAAWEAVSGADGRPPAEVLVVESDTRWGGKLHTERIDDLVVEVIADGKHLPLAALRGQRHDGRFVENDPLIPHINQRFRSAEINRHIRRHKTKEL